MLRPLAKEDVALAAAAALGREPDEADIDGGGRDRRRQRRARASDLLDGPSAQAAQADRRLLDALPRSIRARCMRSATCSAATDQRAFAGVLDTVNAWLSARLAGAANDKRRLLRLAQAFEQINRGARGDEYNLERKPLIFNVFGCLAEAARG